jgi:hypothetical protein
MGEGSIFSHQSQHKLVIYHHSAPMQLSSDSAIAVSWPLKCYMLDLPAQLDRIIAVYGDAVSQA